MVESVQGLSKIHGELILLSAAPRKESQVGLVLKKTSFYFSFLFIDFSIFHTAWKSFWIA